jgi:hypothetical protein
MPGGESAAVLDINRAMDVTSISIAAKADRLVGNAF